MITRHANQLVDEWIDDGQEMSVEVEFISRFARPLPQRVVAEIMGFPQSDVPQLAEWGDAVVMPFVHGTGLKHELTADQSAEMHRRLEGFQDYIYEQVAAKRADPQDDMVSFLCDVHYEALDRKLTDIEIAGIVHAMILGGLETTQYALEEQAQLLCEHPAVFEQLRTDRSNLRNFVEESLRLRAPTHGLSTRMTTRDEEFQGIAVPAGSLLHLRFAAANVDGDEFACPFDLDLERAGVGRHVTFSTGPRVCPGATLSRLEQQVAWGVLLDRLDSIEYGEGNDWMHKPGIMLATIKLHLRVQKSAEPLALGTGRPFRRLDGTTDRPPPLGDDRSEPVGVGDHQFVGIGQGILHQGRRERARPGDRVDPFEAERFDQPAEHRRRRLVVVARLMGDEGAVVVEGQQRVVRPWFGAAPVLVVAHAGLGRMGTFVQGPGDRLELGFGARAHRDVGQQRRHRRG